MHAFEDMRSKRLLTKIGGVETKNMGSWELCAGAKRVFFLKLDIDTFHCTEVCLLHFS